MSKYEWKRFYYLKSKIMGYLKGQTTVRPPDKEWSEYVDLFNKFIWAYDSVEIEPYSQRL